MQDARPPDKYGPSSSGRDQVRRPRLVKIAVLDNEVQAQALDAALSEREITHVMRSYRDSAYDGLFQSGHGWGHVEAPVEERGRILEILADLTLPPPEPEPPAIGGGQGADRDDLGS